MCVSRVRLDVKENAPWLPDVGSISPRHSFATFRSPLHLKINLKKTNRLFPHVGGISADNEQSLIGAPLDFLLKKTTTKVQLRTVMTNTICKSDSGSYHNQLTNTISAENGVVNTEHLVKALKFWNKLPEEQVSTVTYEYIWYINLFFFFSTVINNTLTVIPQAFMCHVIICVRCVVVDSRSMFARKDRCQRFYHLYIKRHDCM